MKKITNWKIQLAPSLGLLILFQWENANLSHKQLASVLYLAARLAVRAHWKGMMDITISHWHSNIWYIELMEKLTAQVQALQGSVDGTLFLWIICKLNEEDASLPALHADLWKDILSWSQWRDSLCSPLIASCRFVTLWIKHYVCVM